MAGGRRVRGVGAAVLCLLLPLVGCGGRAAEDSARGEVQRLLDMRSAALLRHDEGAYDATGARADYARLRALPLASWAYRITGLRRTAQGADAFKVATTVNQPQELARLLDFLTPGKPALAVMGMGLLGQHSRILLGRCGSVLNYGYLGSKVQIPGQWPAIELKALLLRAC